MEFKEYYLLREILAIPMPWQLPNDDRYASKGVRSNISAMAGELPKEKKWREKTNLTGTLTKGLRKL